jgi:hypothetical protein
MSPPVRESKPIHTGEVNVRPPFLPISSDVFLCDLPVLDAGDSFHLFSKALTAAIEEEVWALA